MHGAISLGLMLRSERSECLEAWGRPVLRDAPDGAPQDEGGVRPCIGLVTTQIECSADCW